MSREFRFLATEFAACSKPQVEIIIVKRTIQRRSNVTRVWVEHRLCNYYYLLLLKGSGASESATIR